MRIRIISPAWEKFRAWPYHMSLLGPLTVAGLTPREHTVEYVDQQVESVNFDDLPDLVALSCMTAQVHEGYRIADEFRSRGVPVVIGGIHPTLLPDEAQLHADAVVIGEAEGVWPQVLADAAAGNLQLRYRATTPMATFCDLDSLPRRDLLRRHGYTQTLEQQRAIDTIQTTRGCAFSCEHCNVPQVFGQRLRRRPFHSVLAEIATIEAKYLFFVDDSLWANRDYFSELLRRLVPPRHFWLSVGYLEMAQDPQFLQLMAASGCAFLYMGFDRLSAEWRRSSFRETLPGPYRIDIKKYDVDFDQDYLREPAPYLDGIQAFHEAGIGVFGTFILGFDGDDPTVFERTLRFARDAQLDLADFAILTPYPRSPLNERLEREGRIRSRDWSLYNGNHVVFEPRQMSAEELKAGVERCWREFYAVQSPLRRLGRLLGHSAARSAVSRSRRR